MRNTHAAFGGDCAMASSPPDRLVLEWRNGAAWARLDADLSAMRATITCSGESPW
jgi:hypothetical protein